MFFKYVDPPLKWAHTTCKPPWRPASNYTCHGDGKRGHWKQVCRAASIHFMSKAAASPGANLEEDYTVLINFIRCNRQPKDTMLTSTWVPSPRVIRFQVHINELKQLPPAQITPSIVRLLDYWKVHHPNHRTSQSTLHSAWRSVWRSGSSHYCSACTMLHYWVPPTALA